MAEVLGYVPDQYEQFHAISPEEEDQKIFEKRSEVAHRLKEAIMATQNFKERFRSKSELGAYVINVTLQAMQGRVGEVDARWMNEVKGFYMKLTNGSEASWSGVLAEFSAARMIEKSGNVARFPGNIPEGFSKPRGYNEFTKAEQDRLQSIDWWLDTPGSDGRMNSYAVTVKSMPFTSVGAKQNQIVYKLSDGYESSLKSVISNENIEIRSEGESPLERYNKTIEACEKVRQATREYGTGALVMLMPSVGNDSNINRHTGEPSDEITGRFNTVLQGIADTEMGSQPLENSA